MKLNPLTLKKIKRFKSIKRGYYSFVLFALFLFITIFAELFISNRALLVYDGNHLYFPTYGSMIPGNTFGLEYEYETNYRLLKKQYQTREGSGFVLLPLIPYDAFEIDLKDGEFPPYPPSFADQHYLGTDVIGRDIIARLVYGFRICIAFSLLLLILNFSIGIVLGCLMGFFGGKFDLILQRIIEIWSAVPFLYVIMIISSIIVPSLLILVFISVLFGWINLT